MTINYKDSKRIVALEADRTGGSITLDAESNNHASASATSITISGFTVGNNSNKILIVSVGSYNPTPTVSGITWNSSENFTQINTVANNGRADLWYLVNPTSTTADIVVTYSSSAGSRSAGVTSLYNVNQSTPIGVTNTVTGTGGTIAGTITPTTTGSWIIDSAMSLTGLGAITDTLTAGFSNLIGGVDRSHGTQYSASPTINSANSMTWTNGQSSYAWAGAEIKKAEGDITNVQDNSLLVEKDTARRYWASNKDTIEDDYSSTSGWTSSGAGNISITGGQVSASSLGNNDGEDRIYRTVSGVDSTDVTVQFEVTFSAWTSGAWAEGIAQLQSCTQDAVTYSGTQPNCDVVGVNLNKGHTNSQFSIITKDGTNSAVFTSGTATVSQGTKYYLTFEKSGNDMTLTSRTGSHSGSTHDTITKTQTGLTGLNTLVHGTLTGYAGGTGYTTSYTIDNLVVSPVSHATWNMQPTISNALNNSFTTLDSAKNNISSGTLDFNIVRDGSSDDLDIDLGSVSDTKWVLRFKLNVGTVSATSQYINLGSFGLASVSGSGNTDFIGFTITKSNDSTYQHYHATDIENGNPANYSTDQFSHGLQVETVYVEIIRSSATAYSVELFSDSGYSQSIESKSSTTTATTNGLQYFKIRNFNNGANVGGSIAGTIENMELYNEVSSVN